MKRAQQINTNSQGNIYMCEFSRRVGTSNLISKNQY